MPAELDLLSAEIHLQLRALHGQGAALKRGDLRTERSSMLTLPAAAPGEAQLRAIAQATGDTPPVSSRVSGRRRR